MALLAFFNAAFLNGETLSVGDVEEKLIIRESYLHVMSNLLGSIMAAMLILFFGWGRAAPLQVSWKTLLLLNEFYVVKTGLHVLKDGAHKIDVDDVISQIKILKKAIAFMTYTLGRLPAD